jgi:DNA polymerase elongation subunit (family B)
MKILLLDIETSPNVAHVWGIWQQNVGLSQLLESSYTMCYSAKWLGDDQIYFDSVQKSEPKSMLEGIHGLLEQADAVVHYNGTKFDMPTLNKEFIIHKMDPPPPIKQIDLLRVVKSQFRFPSNKLDYVAQRLSLGKKKDHEGHILWVKCMNGDKKAWKTMEEYNIQDVILLEKLYKKLLPWIKSPINLNIMKKDRNGFDCPTCGKASLISKGFSYTTTGAYQRYHCKACGAFSVDKRSVIPHAKLKHLA